MLQKRNYIFTNRKHSEKGIMSTVLGIISLGSLILAVYFTYQNHGEAMLRYGAVGLLSALFGLTGLVLGVLSQMEKDRYHLFSWLGIGLNMLVLSAVGFILYLGV